MNPLLLACCLLWLSLFSGPALAAVYAQDRGGAAQGYEDKLIDIESLTSVESRKQALAELEAAAVRLRLGGNVPALVRTLNLIGELQLKLNDSDSALAVTEKVLAQVRRSRDTTLRVDTLIFAASVYLYRQDNKTALRLLDEAHALSVGAKYRKGEARSLTELGLVYFLQSELKRAEACDNEALHIWRELQERKGEAAALLNLGEADMRLGKLREGVAALENAAVIQRESNNPTALASTLITLNFLAIRQGQWQKSLALLKEVQSLVKDKEAEPYIYGQINSSLGEVYEAYGQLETALKYFEEALILYRDYVRDESATIDASRKAGRAEAGLGDYPKAVEQINQGLLLAQKIGDRFMVALCHEDLGRIHLASGLYSQAKEELQQALSIYNQTGNRREWARTQTFLGQTAYLQGDRTLALKSYLKALQVFQDIQDYTNEAALRFGLGRLELERQNLDQAGKYLERSIALTEQLRENGGSRDLRTSFLDSVHDRYEAYVEWLMQLHATQPDRRFNIRAFEASEQGRARSLLDSVKAYQRELREVDDPTLLSEEEELQKQEQSLLDKRTKLQLEGGAPEAREKVENELTQVRTNYEILEAKINSTAKFNNFMRTKPLKLEDIRKQITDTETLLEYSLGSRKSYLWVVTKDEFASYELPDKSRIEEAANRVAELLVKRKLEPAQEDKLRAAVSELSSLALGPVAGKLHTQRLIIVPDGILQYIPFQILTTSLNADEPLIARYEIVNAPSASVLSVVQQETAKRTPAPKLLAAFGAPEFSSSDDVALSNRTQADTLRAGNDRAYSSEDGFEESLDVTKLQPLFFAGQELNNLRNLAAAREITIYSGYDATRDNLLKLDLSQYRILHFATHGFLNAKQPERSGLVLSLVDRSGQPVSGFVGLSDIYKLRAPVDLVVLSACRTALGKDMRGEGLIGLTRGFMYAGASSVVASLWEVDDEATSELMKRFYGNMLQKGMPSSAALRAAQNSIRQEPRWRSPHYWAAFTLQGEYRQVIKPAPAISGPALSRKIIISLVMLTLLASGAWWYFRSRIRRVAGYE